MASASFKNFQVGIVDDPSIEEQGGFEFASGMDIFSEPGVLKATNAMAGVTFGTGAAPADVPRFMVDTATGTGIRGYIIAGAKILESTDGATWNLFRTNSNGANLGLGIWAGYVIYPSATKIGRTLVGDATLANDSYITTLDSDTEFHPVIAQGGTLKIGAGRYVASLDESFNFSAQTLKLISGYRIRCLADYLTNLYGGTSFGAATGGVTVSDSLAFGWKGTVLSSGSALPDSVYPTKLRGMNAVISDGRQMFGFPDHKGMIMLFDGVGFGDYRKITPIEVNNRSLIVSHGSVAQHIDESILFAGETDYVPGVFQMKNKAICQAFVPSIITPGATQNVNIGMVKSSFNGTVFIGYYNSGDSTYHIEKSTSNKQNNAMVRTLWHRFGTDSLKRHKGVKLNLKPLGLTSVSVAYRTNRDDPFTDSGYTITASNQAKPIFFVAQPRSREIQYQFTYTTSGASSPELLSYDPIFEALKTLR